MNNLIILKYIKNLTPDDVYTYACKKDIILNSQELSGVYKYIKDNYADYLKGYLKKDVILRDAKNILNDVNYKKFVKYFDMYKDKI